MNILVDGNRIAELRKEKGLTQSRLAELAKINPSTLAAYERNRRKPNADTMKTLAKALGVSIHALKSTDTLSLGTNESSISIHTGNQDIRTTDNLTTLTLTREEARLILFTRMNPESMTFLQKYITSDKRERDQIEKAWRLIHEFQT